MLIVCWVALTAALQVIAGIDAYMKEERKSQDEALYLYCLHRLLVICPYCRIGFEVTDLTEQMNVEWECECCRHKFAEYATHTR